MKSVATRRRGPPAAIARLEGLAGLPTGTGQVTVEVVDDPFIAGRYALDARAPPASSR